MWLSLCFPAFIVGQTLDILCCGKTLCAMPKDLQMQQSLHWIALQNRLPLTTALTFWLWKDNDMEICKKPLERPPPTKQFATGEHPNLLETISWVVVVPSVISQGGGQMSRCQICTEIPFALISTVLPAPKPPKTFRVHHMFDCLTQFLPWQLVFSI